MNGDLGRKPLPQLRSVESPQCLSASQIDLSKMKINLKHKRKAEVSLVDTRVGRIIAKKAAPRPR